jgi:hypothetical protein
LITNHFDLFSFWNQTILALSLQSKTGT